MAASDSQNKFSIENILLKDNGESKVSVEKKETMNKGGAPLRNLNKETDPVVGSFSFHEEGQIPNVSGNDVIRSCDSQATETVGNSNNSTTTSECSQLQSTSSQFQDDTRKRPRTTFSVEQVRILEQEFQRNKYLSMGKRLEISKQLGLTEQQIKIWFQNRRTKWKRKFTNNFEMFTQTPVLWRPSFFYPGMLKYGIFSHHQFPGNVPSNVPGNSGCSLMMNRMSAVNMMNQQLRMIHQNCAPTSSENSDK